MNNCYVCIFSHFKHSTLILSFVSLLIISQEGGYTIRKSKILIVGNDSMHTLEQPPLRYDNPVV